MNFFDYYWFFYILLLISSIAGSSYRIFLRKRRIRNIQLFIFDVSCWFIYFFKFLIYLVLLHYLALIVAFIHRFYHKLSTLIIEAEFNIIWYILNFESKKNHWLFWKFWLPFLRNIFGKVEILLRKGLLIGYMIDISSWLLDNLDTGLFWEMFCW